MSGMSRPPVGGAPSAPTGYEFTAEQNKLILALSKSTVTVGRFFALVGIVDLGVSGHAVYQSGAAALTPQAGAILHGLLFFVTGLALTGAGPAFRQVVDTKGNDIGHLLGGLEKLQGVFGFLRGILILFFLLILGFAGLTIYLAHQGDFRSRPASTSAPATPGTAAPASGTAPSGT